MIIEGVRYHKFRVRFRLADGRVRVWIRTIRSAVKTRRHEPT